MKNKIRVMTLVVFGVLLHFLFFLPAQANAEPALNPVFHKELGSILDEFYAHLRGLGNRWYRHFSEPRPHHKRALITFMLRHREQLGLSPGQVQDLKRLRSDFERETIRCKADIRVAELELETLLDGDPIDLSEVEAKIRQIEKLRGDHRLARIHTIEDGKAHLTPEQREKLRSLLAELQHPRRISGYANRLREECLGSPGQKEIRKDFSGLGGGRSRRFEGKLSQDFLRVHPLREFPSHGQA